MKVEDLLSENPLAGTLTNFKKIRRILILRNFSLYYRIDDNMVQILAFWVNRRNPEDLEI